MELPPEERHNDPTEIEKPGEAETPLSTLLSDLMATLDELPSPDAPGAPDGIPDPVQMDVDPNPPEANPLTPVVPDEFLNDLISDPALDAATESAQQAAEPAALQAHQPLPEAEAVPGAARDESVGQCEPEPILTDGSSGEIPAGAPPAADSVAGIPALLADAVPETEPTASDSPLPAGLDAVVAEIDQQAEAAFGGQGDFAFQDDRPAKGPRKGETCIVFLLSGTSYAIPVRNVVEMDTFPRTTLVPNVPGFVRGVTNVRGEIISVLDLRSLFAIERWEFAERGRILIVRTADQHTAALAVDAVHGTASLSLADLGAPTGPIHDKVADVLLGVGEYEERVLNVLDVDKMFRMPEIRRLTEN